MTGGNRNIVGSIDLGELFAMPLEALINADAEAAKTFAAFIQEYGFERPGPGGGGNRPYGKLKMVSFSYYRPVAGGQPQAFQVEVPLILLIPLPTLAIRDAQLDFSVEIFGMVDKQSSDPVPDDSDKGGDGETPTSTAPLPRRLQRPQLRTRIARAPRTTVRTRAGRPPIRRKSQPGSR